MSNLHLRRGDGRPLAHRVNANTNANATENRSRSRSHSQDRPRPITAARIGEVPAATSEQQRQHKPTTMMCRRVSDPIAPYPQPRVRNPSQAQVQPQKPQAQRERPRARSQTRPMATSDSIRTVPASINAPSKPHQQPRGRVSSPADTSIPDAGGLSCKDFYRISHEIDRGSFSRVYECYHRYTATKFAVKVIDRRSLSRKADDAVFREARILQELQNKRRTTEDNDNGGRDGGEGSGAGFVRLVDFFIEPTRFFLVMDYMAGSTLFDRVLDKHYYSEDDARVLLTRLLRSLAFMHRHDVVHRDLKPQNILLADVDNDTNAFLGDFGFATVIRPVLDETTNRMTRRVLRQKCGTPSYVAPEVIAGKPYDQAADMWSLGVVAFFVQGGYPPFVDFHSRQGMFQKILRGEFEFHETDWSGVSDQAKDFIRALLTVDPNQRMTASEALFHPWILAGDSVSNRPPMIPPSARDASTTSKKGKGVRNAIKAAARSFGKQSSSLKHLQASGDNFNRIRTSSQ